MLKLKNSLWLLGYSLTSIGFSEVATSVLLKHFGKQPLLNDNWLDVQRVEQTPHSSSSAVMLEVYPSAMACSTHWQSDEYLSL
jgi:hypothetical protein